MLWESLFWFYKLHYSRVMSLSELTHWVIKSITERSVCSYFLWYWSQICCNCRPVLMLRKCFLEMFKILRDIEGKFTVLYMIMCCVSVLSVLLEVSTIFFFLSSQHGKFLNRRVWRTDDLVLCTDCKPTAAMRLWFCAVWITFIWSVDVWRVNHTHVFAFSRGCD